MDSQPPSWCEHGPGYHDGAVPSRATAPAQSRAWLLIEHDGLWAERAAQTALPAPLGKLAIAADELGIRVQLIRKPQRGAPGGHVYAGWTAGPEPWLVETAADGLDLAALAAGVRPAGTEAGPLYLVCVHGRRNRCCAAFGGPLAKELASRYPGETWETTHVGGHKFAANLVLLPHGLYYGPADPAAAAGAIEAYQRGEITAHRYRGRAGQDIQAQEADCAALARTGHMPVNALIPGTR
jgi:hypothetical protein